MIKVLDLKQARSRASGGDMNKWQSNEGSGKAVPGLHIHRRNEKLGQKHKTIVGIMGGNTWPMSDIYVLGGSWTLRRHIGI